MPQKRTSSPPTDETPQVDKFKEAAREVETDDRDEAFDEKLRRVAKAPKPEPRKPNDAK
jgi:hypothetical protein